jgi:proteasome assembly chaperone (PAC2) family protein
MGETSPMIELKLPAEARPADLVCAFHGWGDGGQAATTALQYLRDRADSQLVGALDPEEYYDFQVSRPLVRLVDGTTRELQWPANEFFFSRINGKELLIFIGIEPNLRWRSFCEEILAAAKSVSIRQLITLGAFLADVPHTRTAAAIGTSSDPEISERLGLIRSQYEGPTGITGVLQNAAAKADLVSVSFWTGTPHYLPGGPNPRSALALLEKLIEFLHISPDTSAMREAIATWEEQIGEIVSGNAELEAYVKRLEELYPERMTEMQIPTGEELSRQLDEFLRRATEEDQS